MTIIKSVPVFKESRVMSIHQKRNFVPLYDNFDDYDFGFSSGKNDPKEIEDFVGKWQLCRVWQVSSCLLFSRRYSITEFEKYCFGDVSVLLELYLLRHCLELSMKAILQLMSIKFDSNTHSLGDLWNAISFVFKDFDATKGDGHSFANIDAFICWLDKLEYTAKDGSERIKSENPYRYFLGGRNKLLNNKLYVHIGRISEYVFYFLNVIEYMSWDYIKSKPEWNTDVIRFDGYME